jgi:hypothetical protein
MGADGLSWSAAREAVLRDEVEALLEKREGP